MKKVENSLTYKNQMYRVSILWKMNKPALPDKYIMALSRMENTEKRLKRTPEVAHAYNQCFDHYIEKGYVTRVQDRSTSKWYLPHFPVLRPDKDTNSTHRQNMMVSRSMTSYARGQNYRRICLTCCFVLDGFR